MKGLHGLLTVLTATAVGLALGLVVVAARGPCLQTNICRLRPDGSCEPGPCDELPVVPVEVLVCGGVGLFLGLLAVAALARSRTSGR